MGKRANRNDQTTESNILTATAAAATAAMIKTILYTYVHAKPNVFGARNISFTLITYTKTNTRIMSSFVMCGRLLQFFLAALHVSSHLCVFFLWKGRNLRDVIILKN